MHSEPYNHPSAESYPQDVQYYLATEIRHKAIWGPYVHPPLPGFHTSPFLSRPKPNSAHRRMIVDLSWPKGASVNYATSSHIHMNSACALTYPTIDQMVHEAVGKNGSDSCHLFKVDLERAFQNLRIDPNDYSLMGLYWDGAYYQDVGLAFGVKLGSFFCQSVTDAIRHIMAQHGFTVYNYSDDILGIHSSKAISEQAFIFLLALLDDLGLPTSSKKVEAPSRVLTCLGIEFDMDNQEIRIPHVKLNEILELCNQWASRTSATKNQIQSSLGKLVHIGKCVRPARVFINRMLQVLRQAPDSGHVRLSRDFQKDIN